MPNVMLIAKYNKGTPPLIFSADITHNSPVHGALIQAWCLGCPSHGAKFKKRINCVKMVMFHAMISVMGRS